MFPNITLQNIIPGFVHISLWTGDTCEFSERFKKGDTVEVKKVYAAAQRMSRLLWKGYSFEVAVCMVDQIWCGKLDYFDAHKIPHVHGMLNDDEAIEVDMCLLETDEFYGLEGDELEWLISGFKHDGDEHLVAYAEDNGYNPQSLMNYVHAAIQSRDQELDSWEGSHHIGFIPY